MPEDEEDSENNKQEDFDLSTELSVLVEQNIIPSRVAKRLEQKLKERKVAINREQLQIIIEKIRDIMRAYARTKHLNLPLRDENLPCAQKTEQNKSQQKEQTLGTKTDQSINDIVDAIGSLKDNIKPTEKRVESNQRIVTTEDIQVPKTMSLTDEEISLDPLAEIPSDPESVIVLMKWLQYLIDRCGRPNLSSILDYYVDIGWLSEDAKINLIDYSQGITEEKKGEGQKKEINDLPSKDHIQSLIFIQKLKGRKIDKHFVERIDSEISRILRKLDN